MFLCTIKIVNTAEINVASECEEDSKLKLIAFSNPDKELICVGANLTTTWVLSPERTEDLTKKNIQFISSKGILQKWTLNKYPFLKTIVIYKSEITEYSLKVPFASRVLIIETIFPVLTKTTLDQSRYIYALDFHSNPDLKFEYGCFSFLNMLQNLTIYNQTLITINSNTFQGLIDLKFLKLIANKLKNIDKDTFQSIPKLKELILENNPIEHLKANILSLIYLEKLSLMNTGLKKINLPLFFPMKRFKILGLSNTVWGNTKITNLAIAFPNLRICLVNSIDKETDILKELFEEFVDVGLRVKKIVRPIDIQISSYEYDITGVY